MKPLLRAIGRLALFPVILAVGASIGLVGVALNWRAVLSRVRHKGWAIFDSFTPEERKVILHLLLGFVGLAILAIVIALVLRLRC